MHEELVHKARIAEIVREMAEASSRQGTSFQSVSSVDSFTEDSGGMKKTDTAENGLKFIIAPSEHSSPQNVVKLVHEGRFSTHMRNSRPLEKPTTPTEADERSDWKERSKTDNGACKNGATSPEVAVAIKGTSTLLRVECIQNCSNRFVFADNGRQEFRSETLLVDAKQCLEEGLIHLFMNEHSIVQKENFNSTMTELRQEHQATKVRKI